MSQFDWRNKKTRFLFQERFEEDDDDNRRVINYNASFGQQGMAMDNTMATSRLTLDFETSVLRMMMSRRFPSQTRFRAAARLVISQVGEIDEYYPRSIDAFLD